MSLAIGIILITAVIVGNLNQATVKPHDGLPDKQPEIASKK